MTGQVETPGSDVDVVCFTKRDEGKKAVCGFNSKVHLDDMVITDLQYISVGWRQAVGLPVTVLRRVGSLESLVTALAGSKTIKRHCVALRSYS